MNGWQWLLEARYGRLRKPLVMTVMVVATYAIALGHQHALLWAMAALLTATWLAGVCWPHWLLQRMSAERIGPERAHEGDLITFSVRVENHGWRPGFMVELIDRLPFATVHGEAGGEYLLGVVSYLRGGGHVSFDVPVTCERRGLYRLEPLLLASGFPLGLSDARQERSGGVRSLMIYPRIFPITMLTLCGAPSQIHRGGSMLPEGTGAAEFSGLREYRRGDNPRHIHWPSTARSAQLIIREFEPLASAVMHLTLDLHAESDIGSGRESTLEYAIRIAASMARFACTRMMPFSLCGEGAQACHMPAGSGEQHLQHAMDVLACLAADGATPYARVLESLAWRCRRGETVVVFLNHPPAGDILQALILLRTRGAHLLVVCLQQDSFRGVVSRAGSHEQGMQDAVALHELGASCFVVRRGDDLVRIFNR